MIAKHATPMFKTMPFQDGSGWRVEVQWPGGGSQHVDDFGSEQEAGDWISGRSAGWLRKHPAP
jgi:hypothetical protein